MPENNPETPDDLAPIIFSSLRAMDEEATTQTPVGTPTGLASYGYYARPELKRPGTEVAWRTKLAQDLRETGLDVTEELRYPNAPKGRRQSCDIVVSLPGDRRLWLEIKGSWRDYWGGKNKIYLSYLLHPVVPNLDASKSHTVPNDLRKLAGLRPPDATDIAELLISFEKEFDPLGDEINVLRSKTELRGWNEHSDTWMSPSFPGQRVRAWLWWTGISEDSTSK